MSTTVAVREQENAGALAPAVETATTAVAAREKAAIEARFLLALHRPRDAAQARTRVLARCASARFAEDAEYRKPIGKDEEGRAKFATGASIRMMEELGRQWGNLDVQAPVVFDDAERRIIRVCATDLESNYNAAVDVMLDKSVERRFPRKGDEVLSSRVNSSGQSVYRIRADGDAFLVKQASAVAKARRECLRAVVPGDLLEEAMERCLQTRRTESKKNPAAARSRLEDAFFRLGVTTAQLSEFLGRPALGELTEAELELLRAIHTALKEGEATWADVVAEQSAATPAAAPAAPKQGTAALRETLQQKLSAHRERTHAAPPAPAATAADEEEEDEDWTLDAQRQAGADTESELP